MIVLDIGCVCFGLVIGFVTYRTLVHTNNRARINDLTAVLATVGGGAVTALFPAGTQAFGWYAIGLALGLAVYFGLSLWLRGRVIAPDLLNDGDSPRPR